MAFNFPGVAAFINETDNLNDIYKRAMFGNETAQHITQIDGVKKTNALPSVEHERNVLVSAESELTASDFKGDVDISQTDLITGKVAYWNKFRIDDLEGYFTQKYLPRGASYDLGETETVLALLLKDDIPRVIGRQVEQLTWQGDTALTAPNPLRFANGFAKLTSGLAATSTGAFTDSNALTYLEGLVDAAVSDADWSSLIMNPNGAKIYTGEDVIRKFAKQYRNDFTSSAYNREFNKWQIDGTNVMLIGCPGLVGKNEAYLANPDVMVQGSDLIGDKDQIEMGMNQYNEHVWVKVKFRLGFACRDISDKALFIHRLTNS
jgi:hypothetical protein